VTGHSATTKTIIPQPTENAVTGEMFCPMLNAACVDKSDAACARVPVPQPLA
jgi:hypothetical protein